MPGGLDPEVFVALVAAAEHGLAPGGLRVFTGRWPGPLPPGGWPGDEVFFLDASAASARTPGGEASLVKLAVLHRRPGGWERLYSPLVEGSGAPPVLYLGDVGERARQALVYVVELAGLLALSRAERVGGERLGDERVLVRHGPLLQQLSQYMAPIYHVPRAAAEAALRYAGLGAEEAAGLLRGSRVCGRGDRVDLGLLALRLLDALAREARGGRRVFAGVVEDTSRSRVLAASLASEIIQGLAASGVPTPEGLGYAAAGAVAQWAGRAPRGCLEAAGWLPGLSRLSPGAVVEEMIAPLAAELGRRFGGSLGLGAVPRLSRLEAALGGGHALPDVTDSELLYSLVFLEVPSCAGGPCVFTAPRGRGSVAEWALLAVRQRGQAYGCHADAEALAGAARRVLYSYMLPERPPGCGRLAELAGRLGVGLGELAELVQVPPAVRVEWLAPAEPGLLEGLLAALHASSRLVLYGYPPQLLVVDKASRITWWEVAGLEALAEELGRRRQPYRGFLRGWRLRAAMVSPA